MTSTLLTTILVACFVLNIMGAFLRWPRVREHLTLKWRFHTVRLPFRVPWVTSDVEWFVWSMIGIAAFVVWLLVHAIGG
jgi:hypothetical protein